MPTSTGPTNASSEPTVWTDSYDELTDEQWIAYLWWRDWLRLWDEVGLSEEQWATLYLPFLRWRAPT